ncbi:hypothetical protein FHN55_13760 [Streptomyces sp. NP160]|uniref:Trp biosynthesis-associated membrane protein n=1 Tax=Streptomyces sp. NP160 TaxID=2586637 RepID=UPI0011188198|nr:Trp biosynthesis-associated membrane protein [Streptomyces sp. NP160]TNM64574.1 hypothetical protein FHN55_13760 [Streptomyces sp. NP160]
MPDEPVQQPDGGAGRRRRRGRAPVVLLGLVAGGLLLAASTQPWVLASLPVGPGGTAPDVPVSGRDAAAAVPALGVVAVAGSLALSTLRGAGRAAAGALLVLAGLAAVAAVVALLADPVGAAVGAARAATGVGEVSGARTTAWPLAALLPALGVAASGALALSAGRTWGSSERFEAPSAGLAARPAAPSRAGLWDGLSRGEDPTADAGPGPADGSSDAPRRDRAE